MDLDSLCYMDANATTRLAPEVLEAMLPWMQGEYGNPSSPHGMGRRARAALEEARGHVAGLAGCRRGEVLFCSGATEANNWALRAALRRSGVPRLILSEIEHASVLEVAEEMKRVELCYLPVDGNGVLVMEELRLALKRPAGAVSVMLANNETGVVQPVAEVARECAGAGVFFHTDAVQGAGKLGLDFDGWGVGAMSLSAHKFHGPKGVGALVLRDGKGWEPLLLGGGQEGRLRAGTENVAGCVGMGCAAEKVVGGLGGLGGLEAYGEKVGRLREALEKGLLQMGGVRILGAGAERVANTTMAIFEGLSGEALTAALDEAGICVSTGSACSAWTVGPSHVLHAMGLCSKEALGGVRFSLDKYLTSGDVGRVVREVEAQVRRLRASMPGG